MKNIIKIGFITAIISSFAMTGKGQDLHFSQFFNNPLLTNPANTGFIPDADYRLGASYRNQFSNVLELPYKTMSIYGDAQVFRNKIENGWMGLGGVILRDVAGPSSLASTKIYGSVAYHQMLGASSLLSAGFNVGWANKRVDQSKLLLPDQFDGQFFESKIPTSAQILNTNVSYFDLQAGINYAFFPTENIYINAGYSIHHINTPKEDFFENDGNERIARRQIAFLNGILKVAENVIVNPNVYYTNQQDASELMLGMNAAYNLEDNGNKQIIAGLYYRYGDAIIPMVGLEVNNLRFTFSYDASMSGIKSFNQTRGATEFNLMKKGFYNQYFGNRKQTLCPSF